AELETLVELVNRASTSEVRWRCMYRLAQALFYGGPERLRTMFRQHVAPCFFRLYPEGRIVVLRYGTETDQNAAILRCLYAMAQVPLTDLTQGAFEGIQTLENWHFFSLTRLMPLI